MISWKLAWIIALLSLFIGFSVGRIFGQYEYGRQYHKALEIIHEELKKNP